MYFSIFLVLFNHSGIRLFVIDMIIRFRFWVLLSSKRSFINKLALISHVDRTVPWGPTTGILEIFNSV